MSKLWERPDQTFRSRENFSGGSGGGFFYTDRHPSDSRWRLWHLAPALAIVGLIVWGAW